MTHPDSSNPALDVLAKLHVAIGKLGDTADSMSRRMSEIERKQERLNNAIVPLRLELNAVTASAITQQPNQLSPQDGWFWDIATVICQGLTAGQVTMYAGTPVVTGASTVTGVKWGVFTTDGQLNWGKKQFYLNSSEQILLQGNASVPAGVAISIYGTQVQAAYWGDYSL